MADLELSVLLTRTLLGLADLEINDSSTYRIAAEFLGADVAWVKQRAGSAFLDGSVPVSETRDVVAEKIVVEVFGDDGADALANLLALREAFTQYYYELKVVVGGSTVLQYACEKADYQLAWTGPRMIAGQLQAVFSVPRQPHPIVGAM